MADLRLRISILNQESKSTSAATPPGPIAPAKLNTGNTAVTEPQLTVVALRAQLETLTLERRSTVILLRQFESLWGWIFPDTVKGDAAIHRIVQEINLEARLLQTSRIILEIHQRYFLPLLYGLLGTCVFVLRSLTTDIRARTFTETSEIGYRIRLYLGSLSGMVIAWFITPETSGEFLRTLSPFALAFLAGYGVELLFAAMDRILEAFNSRPAKPVPRR